MNGKLRNMTSIYLLNENNQILLLYRIGSRVANNKYVGSAGGHFEEGELNDAKKCVLRELQEETNLGIDDISDLQLKYVTLRYKNEEIRQIYSFFAKLVDSDKKIISNEGNLEWFNYDEISKLDMPHTAKYVVEHFINEGRKNSLLYGGISTAEGVEFTELKDF